MEKRVPKTLRECYLEDGVSKAIWRWAAFLRKCGMVIAIALIIVGFLYAIAVGITAYDEASNDMEALSFFGAFGISWVMWMVAAVAEYLTFCTVALLLEALASVVQHTKISADVTLYRAAKAENYVHEVESTSLSPVSMSLSSNAEIDARTQTVQTTPDSTPSKVGLTQSNVQEYLQMDVCYENVREAASPKGEPARYADARVTVVPKKGVRFEQVELELTVRYGQNYKAFDDVYQDYIYPKGNYTVLLSEEGVGATELTTVMSPLSAPHTVAEKTAEIIVLSSKGIVHCQQTAEHKWRCRCGHMIDTEYCPHCGAKT